MENNNNLKNNNKTKPQKPFWKRWWFWIIIIFVVVPLITGRGKPTKLGENSSKREETHSEDDLANKSSETSIFSIKDQIKLGDYVLTVNSVEDCVESNPFLQPESGNKYVVVDITQENKGSTPRSYNLWYFDLQDNEGYSYGTAMASCKEPSFSSGTLQPEMKTRGYITFQIPEENQPTKLIFTPDWWGKRQIIVNLE